MYYVDNKEDYCRYDISSGQMPSKLEYHLVAKDSILILFWVSFFLFLMQIINIC